jgi:hypothetical protein
VREKVGEVLPAASGKSSNDCSPVGAGSDRAAAAELAATGTAAAASAAAA